MSTVNIARLEQIVVELDVFWHLFRLGAFTLRDVIAEINARRGELGFEKLTEGQEKQVLRTRMFP
jgi:hypothetical protein